MNDIEIHIARDGIALGVVRVSEVRDLLASGFLRESDTFWVDDPAQAKPLTELAAAGGHSLEQTTKRVTVAVLGAAEAIRKRASAAAGRFAANSGLQKDMFAAARNRLLEDFLPWLQSAAAAALGKTSRSVDSALRDEPFLRKLFGAVYEMIPRAVQRFVNERAFIEFCLRHRERLLRQEPPVAPADSSQTNS